MSKSQLENGNMFRGLESHCSTADMSVGLPRSKKQAQEKKNYFITSDTGVGPALLSNRSTQRLTRAWSVVTSCSTAFWKCSDRKQCRHPTQDDKIEMYVSGKIRMVTHPDCITKDSQYKPLPRQVLLAWLNRLITIYSACHINEKFEFIDQNFWFEHPRTTFPFVPDQ